MVALSSLSDPKALEMAINEFRELGREEFRRAYKGGRSRDYVAVVDEEIIDSKPLAAAAYSHQFRSRITCGDFNGGSQTQRALEPLLLGLGHRWMKLSEARSLISNLDDITQRGQRVWELSQILNDRTAIEGSDEYILEFDDEVILLQTQRESGEWRVGFEGWSVDRKTYTLGIEGRDSLDVVIGPPLAVQRLCDS